MWCWWNQIRFEIIGGWCCMWVVLVGKLLKDAHHDSESGKSKNSCIQQKILILLIYLEITLVIYIYICKVVTLINISLIPYSYIYYSGGSWCGNYTLTRTSFYARMILLKLRSARDSTIPHNTRRSLGRPPHIQCPTQKGATRFPTDIWVSTGCEVLFGLQYLVFSICL